LTLLKKNELFSQACRLAKSVYGPCKNNFGCDSQWAIIRSYEYFTDCSIEEEMWKGVEAQYRKGCFTGTTFFSSLTMKENHRFFLTFLSE
jgi:hypothetical protein